MPDTQCPTAHIINPFSKVGVDIRIYDYTRFIDGQPWPDHIREHLDGMFDSDSDWLEAAIRHAGPELAGTIILGS